MLEKILEKLGLSEKEAKVYLATLELGQDSVQNIAKKADVNRPTAYFIMERLMELGLISTLEHGKKTLFVAESPKELENLLNREKQEVENRRNELKESMNQLLAMYNASEGKPVVRYFEGKEGLIALDKYGEEMVKKDEEVLYVTPVDIVRKVFPDRRKEALKDRVSKKVKSRVIYTYTDPNDIWPAQKNKLEYRVAKYLPRDKFPFNVIISIYPRNLIKFYSMDTARLYGVAIESDDFAKNMRLFFELAWLGADQILKK
jgi:HTH-type transcriptional regulator, sugar sensing transcriptional regulator